MESQNHFFFAGGVVRPLSGPLALVLLPLVILFPGLWRWPGCP